MINKHTKKLLCTVLSSVIAVSSAISVSAVATDNAEILSSVKINNGKAYLVKNENIKSDELKNSVPLLKASTLPSKYNLLDYGYVSDVKNQNPYGTCWAFASLASMESNIIKSGNAANDIDLSEKHLIWFNFNGKDNSTDKSLYAGNDTYSTFGYSPYDFGGSPFYAAATMMRRYGAVDESKAPYKFSSGTSLNDSLRTEGDIYLKDVYFLPESVNFEYDDYGYVVNQELFDNTTVNKSITAVKEALINYGAVGTSFYFSDSLTGYTDNDPYWNEENNSYYFDAKLDGEDNYQLGNHGVTIVGWDDNFSKNNFTKTPPKNGAWIAKNSWGENWGDDGYFYLSYYDLCISQSNVFIAEDAKYSSDGNVEHEYENIYQYDGTSFGVAQITSSYSNYKGANIFTARGNETLEAISTMSTYENCTVKYQVYTDLTSASNPTSGTLQTSGTKSFEYAGYYTIPLNKSVELEEGETYSVIIQISFTDSGNTYTILPCETDFGGYIDIDIAQGQSLYYESGRWNKLTSSSSELGCQIGNVLVKAYTNDIENIIGDANSDGVINVQDATDIQKYAVSRLSLTDAQLKCADFNKDGRVDIKDATDIQKYLVK